MPTVKTLSNKQLRDVLRGADEGKPVYISIDDQLPAREIQAVSVGNELIVLRDRVTIKKGMKELLDTSNAVDVAGPRTCYLDVDGGICETCGSNVYDQPQFNDDHRLHFNEVCFK